MLWGILSAVQLPAPQACSALLNWGRKDREHGQAVLAIKTYHPRNWKDCSGKGSGHRLPTVLTFYWAEHWVLTVLSNLALCSGVNEWKIALHIMKQQKNCTDVAAKADSAGAAGASTGPTIRENIFYNQLVYKSSLGLVLPHRILKNWNEKFQYHLEPVFVS